MRTSETKLLEAAELMHSKTGDKSTLHLCRSRVDQCIRMSKRAKGFFCKSLVAVNGDRMDGFLFAEERNAFDLTPDIRWIEVRFLIGRNGVGIHLLKALRAMTKKRILIANWGMLHKKDVFRRMLRPLDGEEVAAIFQI